MRVFFSYDSLLHPCSDFHGLLCHEVHRHYAMRDFGRMLFLVFTLTALFRYYYVMDIALDYYTKTQHLLSVPHRASGWNEVRQESETLY